MNTLSDFEIKQRKYMPAFPKASGKPTPYIPGYPYEDDEPMAATGYHAEQIVTLADQFFFGILKSMSTSSLESTLSSTTEKAIGRKWLPRIFTSSWERINSRQSRSPTEA